MRDLLFSDEQQKTLRDDYIQFLATHSLSADQQIRDFQPFTLSIWKATAILIQDVDIHLPEILHRGVDPGIDQPIQYSGVWHPIEEPVETDLDLCVHDSPWGNPDLEALYSLVQADVEAGFAYEVTGTEEDLRTMFADKVAAGKLSVVKSEGRPDRLVGDGSISNANHRCRILEKVSMPSLYDHQQFCSRIQDEQESWDHFGLDIKSAHKRILVHPSQHGYSIFAWPKPDGSSTWLVYRTCYFGCSWAA